MVTFFWCNSRTVLLVRFDRAKLLVITNIVAMARQACVSSVTTGFLISPLCYSFSISLPDTAAKWPNEMRDVVRIKCDQSS